MKKQLILYFLTTCLFSSCGFHLRGQNETITDKKNHPVSIMIIEENIGRDFVTLLKNQLTASHILTPTKKTQATYWLILENDNTQEQMTGVSSSTTPRQYLLIYTIHFHLERHKKGHKVLPSQSIVVVRQITMNNNRILGSNFETITIKREMLQNAAQQMIAQLNKLQ